MINSGLPRLREHEIPGHATWNKLVELLETMTSDSAILTINSKPGGGIRFDVARGFASATSYSNTLWLSLDDEEEEWSLSAGSIHIAPSTVVSVAELSGQTAEEGYVWIEWDDTTATVQTGASLPHLVNMTNKVCRTPLGRIIDNSGKLTLERMHPGGDIVVYTRPWVLLPGYTNGTRGYRIAGSDGMEAYVTPSTCPTSSESSEGA